MEQSEFWPAKFFSPERLAGWTEPALIILNQPISDFELFEKIWQHAQYRLCADGGANRLHDMLRGPNRDRRAEFLPSRIHGDLDSLRADVREYYRAHGVAISRDRDQESTDFGKAIQLTSDRGASEVAIFGTLAGRVDQGLGLVHEMMREQARHPGMRLWLFSERSVSFILRKGRNAIHTSKERGCFTPNVGILPLYGPAVISTCGLEWDVAHWRTEMGGRVSTSNHVVEEVVQVDTDAHVLFTIERKVESTDE